MAIVQFPSLTYIFSFLIFMFLAVKIVHGTKAKNSSTKIPPGPWRLPLIGNIHQLVGSLPHHRLLDLATKYGPLMHLQLGDSSVIVVSSAEIAKEVLKTHGIIFANRPFLASTKVTSYEFTDIGFAPYGNYWRQLRKICTVELLSTRRVQSFRSIREEETSNLIETINSNEGSLVNLSEKIFSLTYGITARAAFGNKCKDQQKFISIVMKVVQLASGFSIADLYPSIGMLEVISGMKSKVEEIHQERDRILEDILDEHKERKRTVKTGQIEADHEDLVDVFLRLQQDGDLEFPLTNNNIKAVIWDIFAAGSETSSTTVEWAMSEMLKNPRVMKEAQAEVRRVFDRKGKVDETSIHDLKFLKAVIKETLRLHPSAPLLLPRENTESCQIDGYEIPAKTRTIVNAWAIARDPKYWTEAEKFIPERFLDSPLDYKGTNFTYIPFGAGRRICPGIQFALPNVELPLAQMLYHFDWKLPNAMKEEDLDMIESFGVTVRRKNDLILIPIPYRPCLDIK
ncbi:hypothetical protein Ddye_026396 [Dipteronia dyeriana]|uniref:Cytochrome P450 n=1 Tax=Dipteronia dyeriana TaxID=168575 RepID=A0AAD9TMM7_9ROSI|nr:hypothetical protein Ddye_026396 [Dipteronia dyeriana]